MAHKPIVAATVAAFIALGFSLTTAEAAKKQQTSYPAANGATSSLDGRMLGYPRSCWSDTFRNSDEGPYCH